MGHAPESLERAEHVAHAAGHEQGHHIDSLSLRIGITMAMLGVVLAFAAAKVGGERTELVQSLVAQQHAHAKYQAQDIKHRVAVLSLRQARAAWQPGKGNDSDMLHMADAVERYANESKLAKEWVRAYDPEVEAFTEAQEEYELAQLMAEFGIVLASVALLLKRRIPWLLAIGLGVVAVGTVGATWRHVRHTVHAAEEKIEESEKAYRELRAEGKTDEVDQALVEEVRAAVKAAAPAAPAAPTAR
jgi:Domain of unknown function (DUF4337)